MSTPTLRAAAGLDRRASAQRRIRRITANRRLLCNTNGCATLMALNPGTGIGTCPICGSTRQLVGRGN